MQGNPLTRLQEEPKEMTGILEFTAKIMHDNDQIGIVKMGYSTRPIDNSLREAQMIIIGLSVCMMAVISLVVFQLFRVIALTPSEGLHAALSRVASGDLSRTMDVTTNDEIGDLGRASSRRRNGCVTSPCR
jgi:methyl-accepting chemotaxis protein